MRDRAFFQADLLQYKGDFLIDKRGVIPYDKEEVKQMKKFLALLLTLTILSCVPAALAEEQYGYVNEDSALRMASSEKAVQQGTLAEGTKLLIEDELTDDSGNFTWYKVKAVKSGETGYVKSEDVDLVIAKKSLAREEKTTAVKKGEKIRNESDYPVLSASGVIDPLTLITEDELAQYETLNVGDSNAATRRMKERLAELGYITASVTNDKFTEKIVTYIKEFQKVNGMEETGVCDAMLQARLYSSAALNKKGKTLSGSDPLTFTKGTIKSTGSGGCKISFTVKNTQKEKIDAIDFILYFYNTYGERFTICDSLTDEMSYWQFSEERQTLKKNETVTLTMDMPYYFAGCIMSVTGYHTADGTTVTVEDDQYHWYGFGKGVADGYRDLVVTPLTDSEKKEAEEWKLGVGGAYIDADYAKLYSLREGYLVGVLEEGSPLDLAGIQAGDILLSIGDVRIFGGASLQRARAKLTAGESATVLYWRNGDVYITEVTRPSEHEST